MAFARGHYRGYRRNRIYKRPHDEAPKQTEVKLVVSPTRDRKAAKLKKEKGHD
jgi:hypothetical protein